jgi:hypothetical protein
MPAVHCAVTSLALRAVDWQSGGRSGGPDCGLQTHARGAGPPVVTDRTCEILYDCMRGKRSHTHAAAMPDDCVGAGVAVR